MVVLRKMAREHKRYGAGVILLLLLGLLECSDALKALNKESNVTTSVKKHSTLVDLLVDELLEQEWGEKEGPCYEQILHILRNVQNSTLWATWIWDSVQLPVGQFYGARNHLGNFDQCLRKVWTTEDPVPTQYCTVDIKLAETDKGKTFANVNPYDTAESYFHIKTEYGLTFNVMSLGVCTPSVCSERSVERFVLTLLKLSHMGSVNENPSLKVQDCQVTRTPPANSTGLYLLILFALVWVAVAVVCTHVTKKEKDEKSNRTLSSPTVTEIIKAFDLRSNAGNLVSVNKDEIKVMNGMRFLMAVIVVTLHVMFINIMSTAGNQLDLNDDYNRFAFIMSHASLIVDSYFMMSGLLLMKSFRPETGRLINPIQMITKRYFRLIWIFIVTIYVVITTTPYLHGGPMWWKHGKIEMESCKKTWWLGLLMLGNYVDTTNMCMQISWYIPADYHLAVFSMLVYWLYQRNRRGGLFLFSLAAVASVLVPGLYTYYNKLMAITVFDYETISDNRETITNSPMYIYSHLRAGPYFVGLAAGYILSVYKPANYRNIMSKRSSIISFITIVALSAAILLVGAAYQLREYDALESALFAATNRPLWAALNAAFIFICEYGSLPVLPDFFGWSAFVPLSKLSFGIYMCHYLFVARLTLPLRSNAWHDIYKVVQDSLGIVVVAGILSLYLSLFIESPLNNLVSLILKTKPPKPAHEANGDANTKNVSLKDSKESNGYTTMEKEMIKQVETNVVDKNYKTQVNGEFRKRETSRGQGNIK